MPAAEPRDDDRGLIRAVDAADETLKGRGFCSWRASGRWLWAHHLPGDACQSRTRRSFTAVLVLSLPACVALPASLARTAVTCGPD